MGMIVIIDHIKGEITIMGSTTYAPPEQPKPEESVSQSAVMPAPAEQAEATTATEAAEGE